MLRRRYLEPSIRDDVAEKMVFVAGPRQVVLEGTRDFVEDGVRCLPAAQFLGALV